MTPANDNRPASFDAAILALLPAAEAFIARREFDAQKREDILQLAVERALTNWERYPGTYSLKTWFIWQVRKVLEQDRAAARRDPSTTAVEVPLALADREPSAEDFAASIIHDVPQERRGMVLSLVAGKTLREIAAEEGVCHQAIASRMDTLRAQLRRLDARNDDRKAA